MGQQQRRAFDEVKAILGKLDRSIDAARDRRLHADRPSAPAAAPSHAPDRETPPASPPTNGHEPAPLSPQRPGASKYGKARPIRPSNEPGAQWRTA
ncbi:MAG: hypothetical protein H6811_07385 [Phycisphaeraceae bacterium]|nr:hypothetical protein [Phycisphaeraceae bacterium]